MYMYIPDEGESSTLPGEPVSGYVDVADLATTLKHPTQILWRRSVSKVVDLERDHPVDAGRRSAVAHL